MESRKTISFKIASSTDLAYGFIVVQICSASIVCVTSVVDLIKNCLFLFKSSKELKLVVRTGKDQNSRYPKW